MSTLTSDPPRRAPQRENLPSRPARRRVALASREGVLAFGVCLALYLSVAAFLLSHNIIFADALSRVGNAFYVLYSRDRHLPAVGFVWNPLPSLVLLPLLPAKALFPVLVTRGFAGNVQSAACMAGAVAAMAICLGKLAVPRVPRLILTALFAVQPMILLYGGSGLSEAMLLLFMMTTISSLLSWLHDGRPIRLVSAGLALGLAYMTRYEAVAPALAVAMFVGMVSMARSQGWWRQRAQLAVNDVALVLLPFVFAFALWAITAKILVHEWFPTFSSQYGNSAQVSSGRTSIQSVTGSTLADVAGYVSAQMHGLTPLIVPLMILALVLGVMLRTLSAFVAPTVLGAILAFDDLALAQGKSFGWLRFQIAAVPLSILLAGSVLAALAAYRPSRERFRNTRPMILTVASTAVLAMVAIGLPVEAKTLTTTSGGIAREESPMMRSTFFPAAASVEDRKSLLIYHTERQIAAEIDAMHPAEGTVLSDTAYAYSVVLASSDPRRFVVTSDRDFDASVADPSGHGIRYLLVPSPNLGPSDGLQHHWPGLFENGGGVGTLVKEWRGQFFGDWRLYRVS
jgi:hypothetical protein